MQTETINTLNISVENYTVKEQEGGIKISGLALPFNKRSRNGFLYRKQSIENNYKTLIGKPVLFNHDKDRVIGHIISAEIRQDGLYYTADLDPAETTIIRKLKRGDINNVSIQVIYNNPEPTEEGLDVDIEEFLELSLVTIPGFADTTAKLIEQLRKKVGTMNEEIDNRYQNPDGTFKKMTCPDEPNGEESKFCGCVRYMMAKKDMSLDNAKKLCAYIKMKKYGHSYQGDIIEVLTDFIKYLEVEKMKEEKNMKEQDTEPAQEPQEQPIEDIIQKFMDLVNEIKTAIDQLSAKIDRLTGNQEEQVDREEQEEKEEPESKETYSIDAPETGGEKTITLEEFKKALLKY